MSFFKGILFVGIPNCRFHIVDESVLEANSFNATGGMGNSEPSQLLNCAEGTSSIAPLAMAPSHANTCVTSELKAEDTKGAQKIYESPASLKVLKANDHALHLPRHPTNPSTGHTWFHSCKQMEQNQVSNLGPFHPSMCHYVGLCDAPYAAVIELPTKQPVTITV